MRRNLISTVVLVLGLALTASAGSISGKVTAGRGASAVWVEAPSGKTYPPPKAEATMDQKGLLFQPHILVVPVGTTVNFVNSDNVAHNVFWPSISGNKKLGHNLGTWPQGQKRSFKFDNPGVVPLLCNVHPEMSGYIIVSPTPYYAETDAQGNYKIANIPDGTYKVAAWHEGDKPTSREVAVKGDTKADFIVKK